MKMNKIFNPSLNCYLLNSEKLFKKSTKQANGREREKKKRELIGTYKY
jgi:hypothetical protein